MPGGATEQVGVELPGGERPRVLLGLAEVAGYYAGLRTGFEDLGVPVTLLELGDHPYRYPGGHDGRLARAAQWLLRRELVARGARRRVTRGARIAVQALLLAWALPRHDLFILSHGTSFLGQRDLPLLKFCGKQVICAYHGNDSRPPYLSGYWGTEVSRAEARRRIRLARTIKRRIARAERHADGLVNIPTQGHFHERPFVLGLYMGHPSVAAALEPSGHAERPGGADVVCLHAPSSPAAKGTEAVRRIIASLRERGLPVTLREVQGIPNHELHRAIRECDIIVDQLYADYPMPGLATEASWLAKPVVVGGYAGDMWRELLPPDRLPPTAYHRPEEIEEVIAQLVLDPARRRALGSSCRAFVDRHWRPAQVAERYLRLARGELDDRWFFAPERNRDLHGCFLPEEKVRALVHQTLQAGGLSALQLSDKPELEGRLMEFAGWTPGSTS